MKNKYDWFDENWNPDVKLSTALRDLLFSPTYPTFTGTILQAHNAHDVKESSSTNTNFSAIVAVNG